MLIRRLVSTGCVLAGLQATAHPPTFAATLAPSSLESTGPVLEAASSDPGDPELFRQKLLEVALHIEESFGLGSRTSSSIANASAEDLRQWLHQIPHRDRFYEAAGRIADRRRAPGSAKTDAAPSTTSLHAKPLVAPLTAPFPPDYPPDSGAYRTTILDTLRAAPISFTVSSSDRCPTDEWDDFFEVWYLTAYTLGQLEGACVVGGCDPTGVVCLATCTPLELAKIFLDLAVVPIQLCDVHESSVNAAEIEAGYENTVGILSDVAALDVHLTEQDAQLAAHDANLAAHDAKIQARLLGIEGTLAELRAIVQAGQDLTLRIEIEKALKAHARLPVFYLPSAHGGHLETLRGVVVDAIQAGAAAGLPLRHPGYLPTADALAAAGDYKTAFHWYAATFCQVTNWRGEVCPLQP